MAALTFCCLIVLLQSVAIFSAKRDLGALEEIVHAAASPGRGSLLAEYISRRNYQCGIKYVRILRQLNEIVKQAYKEHSECQQNLAPKTDQA
uniref:Secreted protein n=1 Tax=Globodera pallida TaxID=36090 RepID=A0A183C935_GLOPA